MVDLLAFGAHPDDCEFFMAGTLLKMKQRGYRIGICDLTKGEAGTYGSGTIRTGELEAAGKLLDLDARVTLNFPDGDIRNTRDNRLEIIEVIRMLRPELVFSFAGPHLRHPDHRYCGEMVKECCYLSGLEKIKTQSSAHRPSNFIGFPELWLHEKPDLVVDVTEFWEKRQEVIACYETQVLKPGEADNQSKTFIRSSRFWHLQEARGAMSGAYVGAKYGEPFYCTYPPRIDDPFPAFKRELK